MWSRRVLISLSILAILTVPALASGLIAPATEVKPRPVNIIPGDTVQGQYSQFFVNQGHFRYYSADGSAWIDLQSKLDNLNIEGTLVNQGSTVFW